MSDLRSFERNNFTFRLMRPEEDRDTHFIVIIGPNGAGKSRLLGELADAAGDTTRVFDRHRRGPKPPTLAVSNLITDPFSRSRAKGDDFRYLGVRTRAGNSTSTGSIRSITIDSILACLREDWRIDAVRKALLVAGFDGFGVRAKLRPEPRAADKSGLLSRLEGVDDVLLTRQFKLLGEELFPSGKVQVDWVAFLSRSKVLGRLFGFSEEESIALAWTYGLPRPDLTVSIEGQIHDIRDLSVGQMLLVSMIARIAANVEPGSLVLIDEPEVGLHPTWQSGVIPLLRDTIPEKFGVQIFIATHSPHLTADADHVLVPGDRWGEFNEFEGGVAGRSIENLLYRVFEAKVTGNRMVQDDLARVTKYIAGTDREDLDETERAVRRLQAVAGADTPTVNSLLSSFEEMRSGGRI